jgi:hypothetical protein
MLGAAKVFGLVIMHLLARIITFVDERKADNAALNLHIRKTCLVLFLALYVFRKHRWERILDHNNNEAN